MISVEIHASDSFSQILIDERSSERARGLAIGNFTET